MASTSNRTRRRLHRATALLLAVPLTLPAWAPALAQEGVLEEIIVTTQRRAERLQDVPLSVSAFSGDQLEEMGISDIKAITERTPGFTMGMFNPLQTQFYIRGIGSNEDGAGGDQSVIVFIDDVYGGRSAGFNLDIFDVERVEVLRGPQGTLFGKNVVGGAINIITKKPTEEPEAVLEASAGNMGLFGVRGRVMGPLADTVFGKLAFSHKNRDGYLDNFAENYPNELPDAVDSDDLLDIDSTSVRGHLRWAPNDQWDLNLSATYADYETSTQVRHYTGPTGALRLADMSLVADYDDKIHTVLADDRGLGAIEQIGVTSRIEYYPTDALTLTSVTSFRNVDGQNDEPVATAAMGLLRASSPGAGGISGIFGDNDSWDESDTFTQELRIAYSGASNWQWVAGLYYSNEQTERTETLGLGLAVPDGAGGSLVAMPKFTGSDWQDNETNSYAIFGDITYSFNDQWSISAGGRQTEERKCIHRIGTPAPVVIPGLSQPSEPWDFVDKAKFDSFTPKFSLNWTPTNDALLYATYSEGFKSGGWQGLSNLRSIANNQFNPEAAEQWEVGAKTEWFDNRLRLNVAWFTTDYTDLQILQLLVPVDAPPDAPGILLTQNAADAKIEGVEIEFTARPHERLLLSGAVATLDTEFSNFFVPTGFRPPVAAPSTSRDGNALRNAPDWAYNLLVRYEHPLANGAMLALQGDYRHKDKVYQDPDVLEVAAVPAYDAVDFRVSYESPGGTYQVTAWMTNAFDEEYFLHNYPAAGGGFATPAPPRHYGATIVWRPVYR